jgi:hypothetical protein
MDVEVYEGKDVFKSFIRNLRNKKKKTFFKKKLRKFLEAQKNKITIEIFFFFVKKLFK